MSATALLRRGDVLVSLGVAAVRPVAYRGARGTTPFGPTQAPIAGLKLRLVTAPRALPLFHAASNCYGYLDVRPGTYRLEIDDPLGRFLPRAAELLVPDRRPLAAALEREARTVPAVPAPAFSLVAMRPAPGSADVESGTAIFGVLTRGGKPMPMARVHVTTDQGEYVTYSDSNGRYVAPLSFLTPVPVPLSSSSSGTDPEPEEPPTEFITTFDSNVEVYPLAARGLSLDDFPAAFDGLAPNDTPFANIYDKNQKKQQRQAIEVGKQQRLDLAI